jgi:hypothetical protein
MTRTPSPTLTDRARVHANLHPESAEIITELIRRVEGVQTTIRRCVDGHTVDDLDPNKGD